MESKEEGKDKKNLIQSSITPVPRHHMVKRQKNKELSHTRKPRAGGHKAARNSQDSIQKTNEKRIHKRSIVEVRSVKSFEGFNMFNCANLTLILMWAKPHLRLVRKNLLVQKTNSG